MKRTLNIIDRAVTDFGMEVDMNDSLMDILDQATNTIENEVDYDYVSECECSRHYDHLDWSDGMGFSIETDGEHISGDDSHNRYFRLEQGEFHELEHWYDHTDGDYIKVGDTIDTNAQRVILVAKVK